MATYTFLFTDLEGSTRLWETHPAAMQAALAEHDDVLSKAIGKHGGTVFKHTGDGMLAVFSSATDAIVAAAEAQRLIAGRSYPDIGTLGVRMAINTGDADARDDDYFGPALNRASRLLAAGSGGQILVGLVTERLAKRELEDLSLVDLGEYRLRDLARPSHIFQVVGPGLPREFPPLTTIDEIPNNLPTMATSFVGRDQELAEVEKLIRGARLVTLTGVGGAGKTRLAVQVAASMVGEFPGGTWLVELASITDPDLVVPATAAALGVAEQAGRPLLDSIIERLNNDDTLLIVDNCEHLITAGARLVDALLAGAPALRIIATSRELLGIGGEVAYGMRSLSLPEDTSDLGVHDLLRYDAIRLFAERAVASRPDFHLTDDNAAAVIEICRRLDGMPLALELAAARVRSFSSQQIADNLDRRFRLLTGGSRTALPRQQTLSAAIDWSYRLLTPVEQALFERLSVFQGGFTLEAAEQVCTDDVVDEFDMLELIPSLVDKSLVAADTDGSDTRYVLLETIRQFARDLLDEHGQADTFRRRHAEFFVGLAEAAEPHVRGADEQVWWGRIEADLDNLRQAVQWAMEAGSAELGLRIAAAIWRFWWFTVRFSEGVRWLRATLEAVDDACDPVLLAKGHLGLGSLAGFIGLPDEGEHHLRASLDLYRRLDAEGADPELMRHGYAASLINLSALVEMDWEAGVRYNEEALEVARRYDDLQGVTVALGNIAEYHAQRGDLDSARPKFEESISLSEQLGSAHRSFEAIYQLGAAELSAGECETAEQTFRRALHHAELGGLAEYVAFGRTQIAVARHDGGVPDMRAEFAAQAALALRNEEFRKVPFFLAGWLVQRADLDLAAGDLESAGRLIGASHALDEAGSPVDWVHLGRRGRVETALADDLDEVALADLYGRGADLNVDELFALITA